MSVVDPLEVRTSWRPMECVILSCDLLGDGEQTMDRLWRMDWRMKLSSVSSLMNVLDESDALLYECLKECEGEESVSAA